MKPATTRFRQAPLAVLAMLALASWSCGGRSGGPTEPGTAYRLRISTAIQNQETAPTILDAKLFLDGSLVADSPSPGGNYIAEFATLAGPVPSGSHTFSIQVSAQTSTPNRYTMPEAFVDVLDPNNPSLIRTSIRFTPIMQTLETGQSIDLKFEVP